MISIDAARGRQLRDEGCEKVRRETWRSDTLIDLASFAEMAGSSEFSIEQFKAWQHEICGQSPHHPNAWGGLTRAAINKGIITPTGNFRNAESVSAHARIVRLYRQKTS